jgi:hypothetical protein
MIRKFLGSLPLASSAGIPTLSDVFAPSISSVVSESKRNMNLEGIAPYCKENPGTMHDGTMPDPLLRTTGQEAQLLEALKEAPRTSHLTLISLGPPLCTSLHSLLNRLFIQSALRETARIMSTAFCIPSRVFIVTMGRGILI